MYIIELVKQANGKRQNGNSSIAKMNTSEREKGEKKISTQVKSVKPEVVRGPAVVGWRRPQFPCRGVYLPLGSMGHMQCCRPSLLSPRVDLFR